jgi:hypothetical protein
MSVDPMVAKTNEPYEYAGDDPANERDPDGDWTLGVCAQFSLVIGFVGLNAGECLVEEMSGSNAGRFAITTTSGGAVGIGLFADAGGYIQVSNSSTLDGLGGIFWYVGGTAVLGVGLAGEYFRTETYPGYNGPVVWGAEVGFVLGAGEGVELGFSYTVVTHLSGSFASLAAISFLYKFDLDQQVYWGVAEEAYVAKAKKK